MYVDWSLGIDETIRQSDIMDECFENNLDYKSIETMALNSDYLKTKGR